MSKSWNQIPIEEKVERLRSMSTLLAVCVFVLAVMGIVLSIMILHIEREVHPVKPHRTEQAHPRTAWT